MQIPLEFYVRPVFDPFPPIKQYTSPVFTPTNETLTCSSFLHASDRINAKITTYIQYKGGLFFLLKNARKKKLPVKDKDHSAWNRMSKSWGRQLIMWDFSPVNHFNPMLNFRSFLSLELDTWNWVGNTWIRQLFSQGWWPSTPRKAEALSISPFSNSK